MKLKVRSTEAIPEYKEKNKQDPISIAVEFIGVVSVIIGVLSILAISIELGVMIILSGIFIFAFGHAINLLYIISKQQYNIKESTIDVIQENGLTVKAQVTNTVNAKVIEDE